MNQRFLEFRNQRVHLDAEFFGRLPLFRRQDEETIDSYSSGKEKTGDIEPDRAEYRCSHHTQSHRSQFDAQETEQAAVSGINHPVAFSLDVKLPDLSLKSVFHGPDDPFPIVIKS